MNTRIFTLLMVAFFSFTATTQLTGQCTGIGLIGEFNEWGEDHVMDRDTENPALFTTFVTFAAEDDGNESGFIDFKFRQLDDWDNAWGSTDFPTGTATSDGGDIPGTPGTYYVTFNCETGDFSFVSTCPTIGLIGEFNEWGSDHLMDRSADDLNVFTTIVTFSAEHDANESGFVEFKFRHMDDWNNAWGSTDFPAGTATTDGGDIPGAPGSYLVTFNCSTGEFSFESTCPTIGLIGEFNEWGSDHLMDRSADDLNVFTTIVTFSAEHDANESGFVEFKFRHMDDWNNAWGSTDFPAGTATTDGGDIPGAPGTYLVTFNCSTGEFSFDATCGEIGLIGEFKNWAGDDFPLNRSATDPNEWTGIKALNASHDGDLDGNIELKFRQNSDWTAGNWGGTTFPAGTGVSNGADNIKVPTPVSGIIYDVSFNCSTLAYNFVANEDVCGDIGMIGTFNGFGVGEDNTLPTDVVLVRDPNSPSQFSLDYSFTSSTALLFRENADPLFADVWGGTNFPSGTGVADFGVTQLQVPGGNYHITFNCTSGDYNFQRLGSSVSAPQVFALSVDGNLSEPDWDFSQTVDGVIAGEAGDDPSVATFAVAYNSDVLYVAGKVVDGVVGSDDGVVVYVDGNKNGGDYDDSDIALFISSDGTIDLLQGPDGITPTTATSITGDGYAIEVSIPWADLGVTPESGSQVGFDFGVVDYEADDVYQSSTMWNGNAGNETSTSAFGDLLFGDLACGSLSLYSDAIGDVGLNTLTDAPTTYVATYDFEAADNVFFRKDNSSVVSWGVDAFPMGTATIGGAAIPVTTGRYRVSFSCLDGAFSFTEEAAGDAVALADYTSSAVTIDGDLSEFSLDYDMNVGLVDGPGPVNNTVIWGALWDESNLYIAAQIEDAAIMGTGNPWENDAIEMYIDSNHDSDGDYDGDYDTQLILDIFNESTLWAKADGVPITEEESVLTMTANGYNIELSLAWANFGFTPGRNRSIGFTIGNNDNDAGIGRDYQIAWAGAADNWNNTGLFGDLQLAGGPLVDVNEPVMFNDNLSLFPNPSRSNGVFFVSSDGEVFTGEAQLTVINLIGQTVLEQNVDFGAGSVRVETANMTAGTYFVVIASNNGKRAVKKVVLK